GGFLGTVNVLNLGYVVVGSLGGIRVIGIPAVVSLDAFPQAEPVDVVLQNSDAHVDIVLNFKEVDSFPVGLLAPSRQMDLHDPDRLEVRNRKRIGAAFDEHDAGNQPGINIIFSRTGDDGAGNAQAMALID